MSFLYILPFNDFYLNVFKLLKTSNEAQKDIYRKIISSFTSQLEITKKELQKIIEELNNAIAKENYQIIEDMDLDSFYSYTDSSKESLEKLLNYFRKLSFQNSSYSSLYHLLDEIYTLFLQLEDRISTLESYKDIAKFKKVS